MVKEQGRLSPIRPYVVELSPTQTVVEFSDF